MAKDEWMIDWTYEDDSATALIHERIQGSSIMYGIATIENVPCDRDDDGEPCLIREGEDSERLKEVLLISNAPDMLAAIRKAIETLEDVTGLHKPDGECGKWIVGKGHPTEDVWCQLISLQDQLERVEDLATDLECA